MALTSSPAVRPSAAPATPGSAPIDVVASARRALDTEAQGLLSLANSLGPDFVTAIDIMDVIRTARRGRLIVAGIGKSGHIARKMAATFASTGTPAYYIHPGEASHGDLGMIAEDDVVLLLSSSGETVELADMIDYTRRFHIPLIAITARADSTLARHADCVLLLPDVPEACPNGLAPTTSTTMMLGLGDAMAVALMDKGGFAATDFRTFHPGGKLGQRLKNVGDLMLPLGHVPTIGAKTTMDKAVVAMVERNVGCLLVVGDDGTLLGLVTDGDLKRHMDQHFLTKLAGDLMTPHPKTIEADRLASEAMDIMMRGFKQPITSLVVMQDGQIAGVIRVQECLAAGLA